MALSYEDTVLALGPIAFWRLDELSGTVMSDSSGNGNDGVFYDERTPGIPSPIETDPSSSASGGAVGEKAAPVDDQLDIRGGITIGGWILWRDGYLADTATLLSRDSHWGLPGGSIALHPLSITLVKDTWYFLVGVRNGAVMRLYMNAELIDERTDLGPTDEYPRQMIGINSSHPEYIIHTELGATTKWVVGLDASVWNGDVDEPMIFDYALNQAEITAIYEAAINATFLNGASNVVPTAILYSDIEPPPLSFPWRHNWNEILTERLSFRTNVSSARTGAEEGNGLRVVPRRELEIAQVCRNDRERMRLRSKLWAGQGKKWLVPVPQYLAQVTTALSVGATTIPVMTAYKDYEIDGWVRVQQIAANGSVDYWEDALITALNGSSLDCEPLVNSYAAYRTFAAPSKRALLTTEQSITGHTAAVEDMVITARLLPEDEAEHPNRCVTWTPTLKYRDYEVFDPAVWQSNDWDDVREYQVNTALDEIDFNTGRFAVDGDMSGASETFSYSMKLKGNEQVARFLGWFYERAGSLQYLWVATMQRDFEILSTASSTITVRDTNYGDNFALAEPRRDLAFVYYDNTLRFRRVTAFSGSVDETLTLDAGVPSLTDLRSLSLLKFCRLDADQLELAYETNDVVRVTWRFRELLHSPEGVGVSSLSPSASLSGSVSPSGSGSPSHSASPST